MSYDKNILEALQKQVIESVGTSIPVKYVGLAFQRPASGRWWEVLWVPNNLIGETWDKAQTYQGIMRLVLHSPIDGKGAYDILNEVSRVELGFAKGTKLTDSTGLVTLTLTDNPNFLGIFEMTPESEAILSIRYSCFMP